MTTNRAKRLFKPNHPILPIDRSEFSTAQDANETQIGLFCALSSRKKLVVKQVLTINDKPYVELKEDLGFSLLDIPENCFPANWFKPQF